jgi:hypothetical protein
VSLSIEAVNSPDLRATFADFFDTVYEYRAARWPGRKGLSRLGEPRRKYVEGTLVLDDNWPSRHRAEFGGCSVWANYVTYRRNFDAER